MKVNISAKNLELSQSTKDNIITEAVSKKLETFIDEADVVVSKEGRRITVKLRATAYDSQINATGDDIKLIKALSEAVDIMKRKIRKAKTQAKQVSVQTVQPQSDEFSITPIKDIKHLLLDTMSDEQAAYKADMRDADVFHYRDEAGCLSALVRKGDSFLKLTVE